ncbi:MAG: IS630 family transposase [Desulfoferrobacter sp.]
MMTLHDVTVHFSRAPKEGENKERTKGLESQHMGNVACHACPPAMAAERVQHRKVILILASAGVGVKAIAYFVQRSVVVVRRWIRRGTETNDLNDRRRCGRPRVYSEELHVKLVAFYCQIRPLAGTGRWTFRWAALHLAEHPERVGASPSKSTLHRVLRRNKLKPHQSRYFLHISDPEFFPKMEHLIAVYKNPPRNLFFFDESPGIQILTRLCPDVRTEETKKRLEEFEYVRNGTMDVFAFLNYADGTVYAECQPEHTTPTFLGVFERHLSKHSPTESLHYVMDNLSTHCGYAFCQVVAQHSGVECPPGKELKDPAKRRQWLQSEQKRIVIHFTPFHGSWLNLVEIWFGIMAGKLLGESFDSPEQLRMAFDAFLAEWNTLLAHPFRWSYDGKGLQRKVVKRFNDMLCTAEQIEMRTLTKHMRLMTNLLHQHFAEVGEELWNEFAATLASRAPVIMDMIKREDGPQRKKKAEEALRALTTALSECLSIERAAA